MSVWVVCVTCRLDVCQPALGSVPIIWYTSEHKLFVKRTTSTLHFCDQLDKKDLDLYPVIGNHVSVPKDS